MMHGVLGKARHECKMLLENLMESGHLGETRRGERTSCQFHQNVYV